MTYDDNTLCEDVLFRRIKDVTCPASYKSSQVVVSFCGGRNSLLNQVRGVQTLNAQDERGKVT